LNGARSLPETIGLVKTRTWQFAKRQLNWFRRQHEFTWVTIESGEPAHQIVARIVTSKAPQAD